MLAIKSYFCVSFVQELYSSCTRKKYSTGVMVYQLGIQCTYYYFQLKRFEMIFRVGMTYDLADGNIKNKT